MAGVRPLNNRYGISDRKYKLIRAYCQMYPEWKEQIMLEGYSTVKSPVLTGMPAAQGNGDATSNRAQLMSEYNTKIKLVEDTVREVIGKDIGMYRYLLEYVTEPGTTFHYLKHEGMPCEKTHFYKLAHGFYIRMDRKL